MIWLPCGFHLKSQWTLDWLTIFYDNLTRMWVWFEVNCFVKSQAHQSCMLSCSADRVTCAACIVFIIISFFILSNLKCAYQSDMLRWNGHMLFAIQKCRFLRHSYKTTLPIIQITIIIIIAIVIMMMIMITQATIVRMWRNMEALQLGIFLLCPILQVFHIKLKSQGAVPRLLVKYNPWFSINFTLADAP